RDLDPKWKYVRSDGDPNGTKGVDFFHGEEAILQYYDIGKDCILCLLCAILITIVAAARENAAIAETQLPFPVAGLATAFDAPAA
ncbi:hypothetical protein PHMEG_00028145, partial [Phytophthora megakarya]